MDYAEAKRQLLMHGAGLFDAGEAVAFDEGFLGSLRPYRGLREENFHIVMEALLVVGEVIHRAPAIDRDLVVSLWWMCSLARRWGVEPGGMLRRNNLIPPADVRRLERWVDVIESTAWGLMRGCPPYQEVEGYANYLVEVGPSSNIEFFIPLMRRWLSDESTPDPSVVAEALGELGRKSREALPELRRAAERTYACYSPAERCTEEVRQVIRDAIRAKGER